MNDRNTATPKQLERLQEECATMVQLLKQLERDERALQNENAILAREATLCGYQPTLLEPMTKTKRKMVQRKIKGAEDVKKEE